MRLIASSQTTSGSSASSSSRRLGLIPATFLTPSYDITFTAAADDWKRRRKDDVYEDFALMPDDSDEIVFLGGKEYQPLLLRLTHPLRAHSTHRDHSVHAIVITRSRAS